MVATSKWHYALVQAAHCQYKQQLGVAMFRMQVVGQKIAQLEQRKKAAVEKEDYDAAKLIKVGTGEGQCCWHSGG